MAINKVVFGQQTLIDLTTDTVTTAHLESGYTAHGKDGAAISGQLTVQRFYTGSTTPTGSFGNNGDLFLKLVT